MTVFGLAGNAADAAESPSDPRRGLELVALASNVAMHDPDKAPVQWEYPTELPSHLAGGGLRF